MKFNRSQQKSVNPGCGGSQSVPRREEIYSWLVHTRAGSTERGENLIGILDSRRPSDIELVTRQDLTLAVRQGHDILLVTAVVFAVDPPDPPAVSIVEVHPRMCPDLGNRDLLQIYLALDVGILHRSSEVADASCRAVDAYEATDAQFWLADDESAKIRLANRPRHPDDSARTLSIWRTTPPH